MSSAVPTATRFPVRRLAIRLAIASLAIFNAIGMFILLSEIFAISPVAALQHVGIDWLNFHAAAGQIGQGLSPYNVTTYRWTPTAAYVLIPLTALPWWSWQLAHVAAALALPTWRLRMLVLISYPWWYDIATGNLMVFVLLAAAWALRGSRVGIGAFLVMTVLIPRPLMVPLAIYLLVRHRAWRIPFLVMGAVVVATSLASGFTGPFIERLLDSTSEVSMGVNMAPSAYLGLLWAPFGLALAILFAWFRRPGLASLAIQPYWLPNYLLMAFLEMPEVRTAAGSRSERSPEVPVPIARP